MTDATTLLLIEDDPRLARLIQRYLEKEGFAVTWLDKGEGVVDTLNGTAPDMVIMDLGLPDVDGFTLYLRIRPLYAGPIMVLTAKNDAVDQIAGLEMGADDYVTKPIEPRLLLARIRALLRRANTIETVLKTPSSIHRQQQFGPLLIDFANRAVSVTGEPIELTTAEFDLLALLLQHAGEIVSRDLLLQTLRGIDYDGVDRSVDIKVSRLRKKLGDHDQTISARLKTIRGRGYLFVRDH